MLAVSVPLDWVALVAAILTGLAAIITAIAAVVRARDQGSRDCQAKLATARAEAERCAQYLHELRMANPELGPIQVPPLPQPQAEPPKRRRGIFGPRDQAGLASSTWLLLLACGFIAATLILAAYAGAQNQPAPKIGPAGPQGKTGAQGPPGSSVVGPTGAASQVPGPQGPPGRNARVTPTAPTVAAPGAAGATGSAGAAGRTGNTGNTGQTGAAGQSIVGPAGPQGVPGQSIVGPAGKDSTVPGPPGPQGKQGVPGRPGTVTCPPGSSMETLTLKLAKGNQATARVCVVG